MASPLPSQFIGREKGTAKLNFSAVSFAPEKSGQAVEFIQRIKEDTRTNEISTVFYNKQLGVTPLTKTLVFPGHRQLGPACFPVF